MFRQPRTFATFLASISLLSVPLQLCHGSISKRQPWPENANRENQKRDEKAQVLSEQESAILLLRSIIDQANSPEDIQAEASTISGAASLIWSRDQEYARDSFRRTTGTLIQQYETTASDTKSSRNRSKLKELGEGITIFIKALGRRDSSLAMSMLKRYQSARTKALSDSASHRSTSEKLEIAREGLDVDTKESAALAATILRSGSVVPSSFPQFLYDVRNRDAQLADELYRIVLSLVSNGSRYNSRDLLLLGAYPFRERVIIVPAVGPPTENAKQISIGIMTFPLSAPSNDPDLSLAREYASSASAHLFRTIPADNAQPAGLAQSFFLAAKLSGYVNRLGLGDRAVWSGLRSNLEAKARVSGIDESNLQYLAGYADRMASDQIAFLFDNGASLFEKAKKASDVNQRTDFLARGITEMIQNGSFDEAEKKIEAVEDEKVRTQLSDYLNIKVGQGLIRAGDWPAVILSSDRISDPHLRALLLLECATTLSRDVKSKKNRKLSTELWAKTIEALSKLTDQTAKASGLLVAASAVGTLDRHWSIRVLSDAITEINNAKDYKGHSYRIDLSIMSVHLTLGLADSDLETSFTSLARNNWLDTVALIEQMSAKSLRRRAQLGACRAILSSS